MINILPYFHGNLKVCCINQLTVGFDLDQEPLRLGAQDTLRVQSIATARTKDQTLKENCARNFKLYYAKTQRRSYKDIKE